MGLRDLLNKLRGREDDEAVRQELDREQDTREEQRIESGDIEGIGADNRAARDVLHEGNVEDAERFADGET